MRTRQPTHALFRAALLSSVFACTACDGPRAGGPGLEPPVAPGVGNKDDLGGAEVAGPDTALDPSRGATDDADAGGTSEDAAPAATIPVPPPKARGCVSDISAGEHTFACEGIAHDVSIPKQCLAFACGLIIDVHGATMSSRMEDKNTNLRALGREHGYVVVQPSAAGGFWSAAADDAKVFAFANDVIAAFHLDARRIHMTGFSQGGYMTWRFVCAHSDWLASAAPAAAAGALAINMEGGCSFLDAERPSAELPLLYMHGTVDALVNFQGAITQRDAVRSAYETGAGKVVSEGDGHARTRYTSPRGVPFEFLEHDYASNSMIGVPPLAVAIKGHCYPGSDDFMVTEPGQLMAFACEPPNAFTWGEEVIQFFIAHPRPAEP